MILRPHQEDCLNELRAEVRKGHNPLLVAPCGFGKGSMISVIVHNATQRNHHVIFAVHGKSLVVDMSERITKLGIPHGILMGDRQRQRWHKVQVASIDTLHRMIHPPPASILIVDEAHMALSPTWRKTIERYPSARVIGATATPVRLDGKGLGQKTGGLFDSMVTGPTEQDLIGMGYLVGSRVLAPPPPADIGNVKKTAGEFNQKQLATVCDKTKLIGDIVEHWKKHASGRKTNAFAVDQAHAAHITEQFNAAGVPWAYVDAETSLDERARIYKDYDAENSTLMGIASVGCAAIGWDHPICSCLIGARPTASFGLWRQMLGRGSRPMNGKDSFLVLDHAGNTHRHAPYGMFEDAVPWGLDGAAVKESNDKKPPAVATCKYAYKWPDFRNDAERGIINGLQLPCYATFKAGPKQCPYCSLPIKTEARKVEVEAGELTEVVQSVHVSTTHQPVYEGLLATALRKGHKPGWAAFVFKSKYKYWPPKSWGEGVNA